MDKVETTVSYMDEAGWFDSDVYVVWTHGCTDGWPRAIFYSREGAEVWVKNIPLNPEGYDIISMNMSALAKEIAVNGC